jgi:hypothetical protein
MPAETEDQELWLHLARETYTQRGEGFNPGWLTHLVAAQRKLGAPLARSLPASQKVWVGNKSYILQPFGGDTLYYEFPEYQRIRSLNDTLGGSIPSSGRLGYELLARVYDMSNAESGTDHSGYRYLNRDWTFHQVAARDQLGAPLSPNYTIQGGRVALQIYANDTLFSQQYPTFRDCQKLSSLADQSDPLAIALWEEAYHYGRTLFDPSHISAFHQEALANNLGMPLSGIYRSSFNGIPLNLQVFSRDTLYSFANSSGIRRWSDLPPIPEVLEATIDLDEPSPAPPFAPALPGNGSFPGSNMVSLWLAAQSAPPPAIRKMIGLALKILGNDADVLPKLTQAQRSQMAGTSDIVCADLISLCLKEAGVTTTWTVTQPPGTLFAHNRAANYYRPEANHPFLVEMPANTSLVPGDILVFRNPTFAHPSVWKPDEYHHVVLFVGHYAGRDVSGRSYDGARGFDIVSSSIGSPHTDGYTHSTALNGLGYAEVRIIRHRQIAALHGLSI